MMILYGFLCPTRFREYTSPLFRGMKNIIYNQSNCVVDRYSMFELKILSENSAPLPNHQSNMYRYTSEANNGGVHPQEGNG